MSVYGDAQVRPVREGVKESEFAYYGSGFVQVRSSECVLVVLQL